jgi:predicted acyltransferase
MDLWSWGRGKSRFLVYPWLVLGSNAIMAYMFSELVPGWIESIHFIDAGRRINPLEWMVKHVFLHLPDMGWTTFAFAVFTLSYCFIPMWILYRYKIFVKV